ncbi:MAG: enoyl-CoA hydratase-related protein [Albidovulum sp.]|nr:enoyl-CoA hydratase-related protein [Albidovulum sp.]
MEYEALEVRQRDNTVVIALNRPEVMNALNAQMRREITYAVRKAPESGRALVITGSGKAFCSGQDLGDRVDASNVNLERTLREEYFPMLEAIKDCPIPIIGAVNGPAAGAGANLALAADVVIAAESAYFMQAFSRIGLIPDAGGTWLLPRKIGLARSIGASLFAEKISARQAADWGMIWESVVDENFEEHWQRRAMQLAQGPTEAYMRIKKALGASFSNGYEEQLELEARLQGEAGKSRDFQEGVLAFVEKRRPVFEGR